MYLMSFPRTCQQSTECIKLSGKKARSEVSSKFDHCRGKRIPLLYLFPLLQAPGPGCTCIFLISSSSQGTTSYNHGLCSAGAFCSLAWEYTQGQCSDVKTCHRAILIPVPFPAPPPQSQIGVITTCTAQGQDLMATQQPAGVAAPANSGRSTGEWSSQLGPPFRKKQLKNRARSQFKLLPSRHMVRTSVGGSKALLR